MKGQIMKLTVFWLGEQIIICIALFKGNAICWLGFNDHDLLKQNLGCNKQNLANFCATCYFY